jgi:hypothetical protein
MVTKTARPVPGKFALALREPGRIRASGEFLVSYRGLEQILHVGRVARGAVGVVLIDR